MRAAKARQQAQAKGEPDSLESAKIVQARQQGNIQGVKYKVKSLLLL